MPASPLRPIALAVTLAAALVQPVPVAAQQGLAGPYLAARHASMESDYAAAARYYSQALASDPNNPGLLENAVLAFSGLGQVDSAVPIARRLQQSGVDSQVAHMVLLADQMQRGQFGQALDDMEAGRSIGPLVDGLTRAWAHFGAGRMSEALDAFDAAAEETGLAVFGNYHKALALAAVGDFEGADAIFTEDERGALHMTRRGVLAHVQILGQLERHEDAVALLDEAFGPEMDPGLTRLRARLAAGEALPFDIVTSAQHGAAEVFYTVAGALRGETGDGYTLLYSRMAEHLRPGHVDATLLSAALLDAMGRYDLATEAYRRVPSDDAAFYAAEMGRAETLERAGKVEAAIEVMSQLAKTHGSVPVVHVTLGDMHRRQKEYRAASLAYDAAIDLFAGESSAQWFVYYARGITHERLGEWPAAEADFRRALELEPGQPQVLNYLGYSFVEMQTNLDEALDMIERAVEARPNDGYITDSLGWVLFRLGRYEEAVPYMERAVELMPIDPVVNDHLGDVLWAVDRKLEAEFQWRRALSFIDPEDPPADIEPDRVRRKLEVGLDTVLAEEGAAPLKVANGD